MLKSTKLSFLFFRNHISDEEFKKGRIFYHAIKSKLITGFKSIFNHRSNMYHLYRTYITDGNIAIDWENSRSVSDAEIKDLMNFLILLLIRIYIILYLSVILIFIMVL